jgi:hypothetical protein
MATWVPINGLAIQLAKNAGGAAAADYYLKFYDEGTTTPASMATDSTGGTTLDKCKLDANGLAVNGSDDPFIPHIDRNYKLACYTNATDADNNTTGSAFFVIDNIKFAAGEAGGIDYTPEGTNASTISIATYLDKRVLDDVTALRAYEPVYDEEEVFISGYTERGKGGGKLWHDASDITTADNGVTVFVTAGGARWKRPKGLELHVMEAGAICDGTTNDTVAVQRALDVAGKTLNLGDNNSILTDALTVPITLDGIKGSSTLLAASNNITVLTFTANTNRANTRKMENFYVNGNGKTGVTGIQVGTVTDNPSPGAAEATLYMHWDNIMVKDCETGVYSYVTMEHTHNNCVFISNTVGFKLYSDLINGGANANSFYACRFQSNAVGLVVKSVGPYALHNNLWDDCLFQGNSVCGVHFDASAANAALEGCLINNAHFESNGGSGSTTTIDGISIPVADISCNKASITISNMDIASTLPIFVTAANNSKVAVDNVTGYGLTTGRMYQVDDTSSVVEDGPCKIIGTKQIESYGHPSRLGSGFVNGYPLLEYSAAPNNSAMTNPAMPDLTNVTGTAGTGVTHENDQFGMQNFVTFAASPGSSASNRNYWYMGNGVDGDFVMLSFLMRTNADTVLRFESQLGGAGHRVDDVSFTGLEWRRIIITGQLSGSTTGLELYIYPQDSVGASAYFVGHQYLSTTNMDRIASTYRNGTVGLWLPHKHYLTAAPTSGLFSKGAKVYNSNPTVDGNNMILDHWLCTAGGSPGTWVAQYFSTASPAT